MEMELLAARGKLKLVRVFLGLSLKSVHFHHLGFYHLAKFKVKVQMDTLAQGKMDSKIRCQQAWYWKGERLFKYIGNNLPVNPLD